LSKDCVERCLKDRLSSRFPNFAIQKVEREAGEVHLKIGNCFSENSESAMSLFGNFLFQANIDKIVSLDLSDTRLGSRSAWTPFFCLVKNSKSLLALTLHNTEFNDVMARELFQGQKLTL